MRLSFRDRLAENAVRREKCLHGTDFLENLIFCGGRAVIVKGKFDIAGREENKLIFTTIRPYNEIIKTLPKICDRLTFPVDALWKIRLMEKAVHKDLFYIIGHIKVVYENGRPKGTLVLAPDVFTRPILTENQFEVHYAELRKRINYFTHFLSSIFELLTNDMYVWNLPLKNKDYNNVQLLQEVRLYRWSYIKISDQNASR